MTLSDITYHPSPSPTKMTLPKGACDTHCHVFGPVDKFPYAKESRFRPGEAPKEKLFALHDMMGIERCVIVQSGCHGYDNSVTADAIASRPGRYLGVALLKPDAGDDEIKSLHNQGFRAVRFNYMAHLSGGIPMAELEKFAARLAEFDWHLAIHMDNGYIAEMAPTMKKSKTELLT